MCDSMKIAHPHALHERPELRFQSAADLRTQVETLLISPDQEYIGQQRKLSSDDQVVRHCHRRTSPSIRLRKGRGPIGQRFAVAGFILLAGVLAFIFFSPRPPANPGDVESVDFDSGALSDFFTTNMVFGNNPYSLAPLGVNGSCKAWALDDSMATEGTLVFKKKSYDLSKLASLEISCLFRRQAIGPGTQAIRLGLTQSTAGNLSGVKGDGWVGLRLSVQGESYRMEFQAKQTGVARTNSLARSRMGDECLTEVGKWYQYKVTFTRVNEEAIRVTGEVRKASDRGQIGSQVGYYPPVNYWVKDFPLKDLLANHELWVALRANGAGGVDAVDNLRIVARPLPVKISTPAPDPRPNATAREASLDRMNGYLRTMF